MRRHHSTAVKAQTVQEFLTERRPVAQSASEYGIYPNRLNEWSAIALRGLPGLFADDCKAANVAAIRQMVDEHRTGRHSHRQRLLQLLTLELFLREFFG